MLIGYPSSYNLCTLKPLSLKKTGLTYVAIQCTLKFSKMMNIFGRDVLSGKCIQGKGLVDTECLPEQALILSELIHLGSNSNKSQ